MGQYDKFNITGAIPLAARDVLRAMGLSPWEAGAITAYMAREKAKAPRANFWYYFDKIFKVWYVAKAMRVMYWGALLSIVMGIGYALYVHSWTSLLWGLVPAMGCLLLALGSSHLSDAMYAGKFRHIRTREPAHWVEYDLDNYLLEEAPWAEIGNVAGLALSIFPGAVFRVHDLRQSGRSLDPVLWVVLPDNERIALLVWDADGVICQPPA